MIHADPRKLLVYERVMFAFACAHAFLFLLFGCLAVMNLGRTGNGGRPAYVGLGLVLFLALGMLSWRRAWKIRCARLAVADHA